MRNFKYLCILFLIIFNNSAKTKYDNPVFHGAYTFETNSLQKACAVYVSIFNNTKSEFVISSLSTDVAEKAEIHDVIITNEIVRMKKVDQLTIQPNEQVYFQPGGSHIMLMNLKQELADGSSFFITFKLDDGRENKVKVMVLNKKLRENFLE